MKLKPQRKLRQAFSASANAKLYLSVFLATLCFSITVLGWYKWNRSPKYHQYLNRVNQPILFSHKHHAGQLGIDCRFCHQTAEHSPSAGMPASETCWSCHSQIYTESPMLEPLRESISTGKPIHWKRVTDLKDIVYFDHSAHITNGISCQTCHGDVANMSLTYQAQPLTMRWCLDCHRSPQDKKPKNSSTFATASSITPPVNIPGSHTEFLSSTMMTDKARTDCYTCHR